MNYIFHLLIYLNVYVIVALGLNMVVGYCGILTLAHASYFAIGSYTYALAAINLGWGFLPSAALGAGLAVLLSLVVSLPAWRLKGDFFIMVSLAIQALIFSAIYNWSYPGAAPGTWRNLTNGPFGLGGVSKPVFLGFEFDTISSIAILSSAVALICMLLAWALLRSPWGRVLQAMRDNELAARGIGKNARILKVQVFGMSCGLAAIGGAIYAAYVGYIDASLSSLDHNILILCMVLIGGAGNFQGPIVGAAVLIAIPEVLRFAGIPDSVAAEIRLMAYGLLLIVMMRFRPQGLVGRFRIE